MERDFGKELKENELYQFLCSHEGCKVFWLSQDGAHDALADVEATRKCYFELKKKGIL